jgi:SPP1 gp7 family putative phage head morphogenesis protein
LDLKSRLKTWFGAEPHTNGKPLESKSHTLTLPTGDFFPIDGEGSTLDREFLEVLRGSHAYITSVLCHAAMRYRAIKVAEAPLMVADDTDDGLDWVEGHELAELLQYPNDDEDMADLLEQLSISLDSTGMGLFVKDMNRSERPGRLTFFDGNEFTVHPTRTRIYGEFKITAQRVDLPPLPPERVILFRIPRPGDRWSGLGPLQIVAKHLQIEAQILTSLMAAIPNAVVPGLTVVLNDGTTIPQMKEFADYLRAAYSSARNHAKPLTVADVKEVKQNTLGFNGLAGGELYREIESAVCVAFQVRPEILGMMIGLENAPWSHMQTAQRLAYDEGIIPLWRRIERALTRQLLRPIDDTPDRMVAFDQMHIRALREDSLDNAKRQLLLKGIATKNQRRVIAGLSKEEGPEWDEIEEDQTGGPGADLNSREAEVSPFKMLAKSRPDADLIWTEFELSAKAIEDSWVKGVEALLASTLIDLKILLARTAGRAGDVIAETALGSFLSEVAAYVTGVGAAKLRTALGPMVNGLVKAEGLRMTARYGIDFNMVQAGLDKYAREETAFLVSKMGETTGRAVAQTVQKSLDAGESVPELRKRLEALPEFSRQRAELVARTESVRATNGAQWRTMSEYQASTTANVMKSWISSRDSRVRDEHEALDNGEWLPIDQAFANQLQKPGEPNCRCTLTYRIMQEA